MQTCVSDFEGVGLLQAPLEKLMVATGYKAWPPNHMRHTENTAMTQHNKKTYALVEVDYPFQVKVKPELDDKRVEIESVGYDNFGG